MFLVMLMVVLCMVVCSLHCFSEVLMFYVDTLSPDCRILLDED